MPKHRHRYPVYGCATGKHTQHRSWRAAARCFTEHDDNIHAAAIHALREAQMLAS